MLHNLTHLNSLLIALIHSDRSVLSLVHLTQRLIVSRLRLQNRSRTNFKTSRQARPPFHLVRHLLNTLTLPLLTPVVPGLDPMRLNSLRIVNSTRVNSNRTHGPLIIRLDFRQQHSRPLSRHHSSYNTQIHSYRGGPFPQLHNRPLAVSLMSCSRVPCSGTRDRSFSVEGVQKLHALTRGQAGPGDPRFQPSTTGAIR